MSSFFQRFAGKFNFQSIKNAGKRFFTGIKNVGKRSFLKISNLFGRRPRPRPQQLPPLPASDVEAFLPFQEEITAARISEAERQFRKKRKLENLRLSSLIKPL